MAELDHFIRTDVRAFLDMLEAIGHPPLNELALDEAREAARTMTAMADAEPHGIAVVKDLTCPGPAGDIPLRFYDTVESREPGPVIAFFHGGGFVIGCLESYHSLCTDIAVHTGLPVVSVDYRLAPEHPFPAAPDDCEAAARWIATSPAELGRQVTGLITMGDSAGGNLTIVTSQSLGDRPADVPVVLQVPIYPVASPLAEHESFHAFGEGFMLTRGIMAWFTRSYGASENDRRNYPILAQDHSATPPTVVITAGLDPLRDSGREYASHLVQCGIDVVYLEAQGVIHGFTNIRKAMPSVKKDMDSLYGAIKLMLERHS